VTAFVAPPAAQAKRPRALARWLPPVVSDPAGLGLLETELRLPSPICSLLSARGYRLPEDAKRFLRPRLEQLHAPDSMLGLRPAAERLARAVRAGETILVHGDYDVDGICSTTLLTSAIRGFGGRAVPFTPRRLVTT
jgi:single-stranded-DNA-specific exonuclease